MLTLKLEILKMNGPQTDDYEHKYEYESENDDECDTNGE